MAIPYIHNFVDPMCFAVLPQEVQNYSVYPNMFRLATAEDMARCGCSPAQILEAGFTLPDPIDPPIDVNIVEETTPNIDQVIETLNLEQYSKADLITILGNLDSGTEMTIQTAKATIVHQIQTFTYSQVQTAIDTFLVTPAV